MRRTLFKIFPLFLTLGAMTAEGRAAVGSEEEFNAIIEKIEKLYQPIVAVHNQTLSIEADWNNAEVNAQSQQGEGGTNWYTFVTGGMARLPQMTADGFALTVCHEIGHHLAGYPMYVGDWGMINSLASEGQSDYYAAQACLRDLWKNDDNSVDLDVLPQSAKDKCDQAWPHVKEQQLCYRIVLAGKSAAETWAAVEKSNVSLESRDPKVTDHTNHNYYPSAQCRLDTYVAGALCGVSFDHNVIPGRLHPNGQQSKEAFDEAMKNSCTSGAGMRPACWFYPRPAF